MTNDRLDGIWQEWEIVRKIGQGSFGAVYEAVRRDHQVESRAAIKVISIPQNESEIDTLRSEGLGKDATRTYLEGVVNDFVSEIQLMESFKGVQNIVSAEDYKIVERTGEIGWDIYIRMELLTPFNTYIREHVLDETETVKLGIDICRALDLCQKKNVIHRDIKPENIFVNDFGHFKLGDFGIARKLENMTGGLSQKGTYSYMAPEVEQGTQYDARADIYSLGLVLYRCLNNNRLPFLETEQQLLNPEERTAAVRRRLRGEPLPPPCCASPEMAEVVLHACSFDPERRFSSASEMMRALISAGNGKHTVGTLATDWNGAAAGGIRPEASEQTVRVRPAAPSDRGGGEPPRKPQNAGAGRQKPADFQQAAGNHPKKKKKTPVFKIAAGLLGAVILAGAALFAVPRVLDIVEGEEEEAYSDYDSQKIDEILEDAGEQADNGNIQGALNAVNEGLQMYPESEELKEKAEEYEAKRDGRSTEPEEESEEENGTKDETEEEEENGQDDEETSGFTGGNAYDFSDIVKTYAGTYRSSNLPMAFELEILSVKSSGKINAIFTFCNKLSDADPREEQNGIYNMEGTVESRQEDGSLNAYLEGTTWRLTPKGYSMIDLNVTISADRMVITDEDYRLYGVDQGEEGMYDYPDIVKTYAGNCKINGAPKNLLLEIERCDPDTGDVAAIAYYTPYKSDADVTSGKFSMAGKVMSADPDGSLAIALMGQDWIEEPGNTKLPQLIYIYVNAEHDTIESDDDYEIYVTG